MPKTCPPVCTADPSNISVPKHLLDRSGCAGSSTPESLEGNTGTAVCDYMSKTNKAQDLCSFLHLQQEDGHQQALSVSSGRSLSS